MSFLTTQPEALTAAAGNLLGPLTIGHLFDTIGRRKMIAGTYFVSGALLAFSAFAVSGCTRNSTSL